MHTAWSVARHLGLSAMSAESGELDMLIVTGAVRRPRSAYRKAIDRLVVPQPMTSAELLDRDDRI